MRFFDLHCDTITECRKTGQSLRHNDLHLDLQRGEPFDTWVQVFALWIPDTLRGAEAWQYYADNIAFFRNQSAENALPVCVNAQQLEAAVSANRPAAVSAVEGGAVLGGELDKLKQLYADGVRILTLTWNAENELGYGCQSDGGHLKPFGRAVVRAMETMHMIPDVSHLDRVGFYDVLEQCDRPVLASHSTSFTVLLDARADSVDKQFSMRRALDDDQIRALSAHGGLIGLNFCGSFLGDPGQDGMPAALRHAAHILDVGGADILAVGSDFDGCTIHPDMAGIERIPALYSFFLDNGFDRETCEKIFFDNAWHFMKNVL